MAPYRCSAPSQSKVLSADRAQVQVGQKEQKQLRPGQDSLDNRWFFRHIHAYTDHGASTDCILCIPCNVRV